MAGMQRIVHISYLMITGYIVEQTHHRLHLLHRNRRRIPKLLVQHVALASVGRCQRLWRVRQTQQKEMLQRRLYRQMNMTASEG